DFDEDDLNDYQNEELSGGEEFIEDELSNEDLDLLYDLLPKLKDQFANYNNSAINDQVLKETLWYNYYNLEDSIKEIKSKFKPVKKTEIEAKKIKTNFSKASPDDIIIAAQKQAFESEGKQIETVNKNLSNLKISNKKGIYKSTAPKLKNLDVRQELIQKNLKPALSFVVFGHVDSGKSTMIGRLLYDLKIVDSKTLHKLTLESERMGKSSFALAWVMDQTSEERTRGVTIDIVQTQFETNDSNFTIIDSPGHKDFIPQMINGVSQADLGILIIDANNFESGFGLNGQTREQILIAKNLGLDKLVIAINKMDIFNYDQDRFQYIKEQLLTYLTNNDIGYELSNLKFLPCSGLIGGNIVNKFTGNEADWYQGGTLIELLEEENKLKHGKEDSLQALIDELFLMTTNDIDEGSNKGDDLTINGRINSGIIQPGESIISLPTKQVFVVEQSAILKENNQPIKQKLITRGEFVTLKLKKNQAASDPVDETVKVGDVFVKISNANFDLNSIPIKNSVIFKASLKIFESLNRPLLIGTPFVLFRNSIAVPAKITKIHSVLRKTLDENGHYKNLKKTKNLKHVSSSQSAQVDIQLMDNRQLPLTRYQDNTTLGRVVIRKDGIIVSAGVV
ncbi:hypothetical protein PACTADRAFT_20341, partial [Pachysolen tannophilus NRRL Y-2460]